MGHARALITIENEENQLLILHQIVEKKLSVRQVEEIVRRLASEQPLKKKIRNTILPFKFERVKETLNKKLNTKVELKISSKGSGSIIIPFRSDEEFDSIVSKLES